MYTLKVFGKTYQVNRSAFLLGLAVYLALLVVTACGLFKVSMYLFSAHWPAILLIVACIQVTINGTVYSIIPHRWLSSAIAGRAYSVLLGICLVAFFVL